MALLRTNDIATRLRLASGLVLFAFLLTHLLNHSLALVSMDVMLTVQDWRQIVTRSVAGTLVLSAAIVLHAGLGLSRLATRATLNLPRWQQLQILSGVLIPLLLLPHVIETRMAHEVFGVDDGYLYVLALYWPEGALLQLALVVVAWLHAMLGLHNWLCHRSGYGILRPVFSALTIAIPLLAIAGFAVAGRSVADMMADPQMTASVKSAVAWPSPADRLMLESVGLASLIGFIGLLSVVAIFATVRHVLRIGSEKIPVAYLGGPTLRVARGPTLLEFSQMHRVPHAAACGGRGRCGTCRVRVDDGLASLPAPRGHERKILAALRAPADVRLACRIRPTEAIAVSRLVNPARISATGRVATAGFADTLGGDEPDADAAGVEKPLVVLAVDIVDFRTLNARRLACDKLHLINAFVGLVDAEARARGGFVERALADGVIAVFGHRDGLDAGCRHALETAAAIDRALDGLNANLAAEIGRDIELGMAVYHGRLLLGPIGPDSNPGKLSVVGEAVAIAGRLETLNRDIGSQLIVPREFANRAGLDVSRATTARVEVRGLTGSLEIVAFPRARILAFHHKGERHTLQIGKSVGGASAASALVLAAILQLLGPHAARAGEATADLLRRAGALADKTRAEILMRDAGVATSLSQTAPVGRAQKTRPDRSDEDSGHHIHLDDANVRSTMPHIDPETPPQLPSARLDIEIPLDGYDPALGFDDKTRSLLTIIARALAEPSAAGSRFLVVGHAEADIYETPADVAGESGAAAAKHGTAEARAFTYAQDVKEFLLATPGLSAKRLVVETRGAAQLKWPQRPNNPANRRVVILSLPTTGSAAVGATD